MKIFLLSFLVALTIVSLSMVFICSVKDVNNWFVFGVGFMLVCLITSELFITGEVIQRNRISQKS
jgi:hypothetical protein